MAKDYPDSPKIHPSEHRRLIKPIYIAAVSGLCVLFYILGAWHNTIPETLPNSFMNVNSKNVDCKSLSSSSPLNIPTPTPPSLLPSSSSSFSSGELDFKAHHQLSLNVSHHDYPACDASLSEHTPCHDPQRAKKFKREKFMYRERHCPQQSELLQCMIPAPPNYRNPFKWPQSRDYAWYANIPHRELSIEKAVQNWIQVEGDKFHFPGGGTMFPLGADSYIDDINDLIPLTDGNIRTSKEEHLDHVICT